MRTIFALVMLNVYYSCLADPCNLQKVGFRKYICLCNATYCDTYAKVQKLAQGKYNLFVSNRDGLRVEKFEGQFKKDEFNPLTSKITINRNETYQDIIGFGASFTDSAGINIASLSEDLQESMMRSMFSEEGSEYSIARVPIGGTDFSPRGYTYQDDQNASFSLQHEDFKYKIPYILQAIELSETPLKLMASVWSAPIWAKTNNKLTHGGFLKTEYYQWWADYFIKFFDEYEKQGIKFWAVTTQNEPGTGLAKFGINSMAWFPYQLRKWIKENLGPVLKQSNHSDLKLVIHDDQRASIIFVLEYYEDPEVLQYIDGVAVHWYFDAAIPPSALKLAKTNKKDIFLISTEACTGFLKPKILIKAVSLGDWGRAEMYAKYMLQDLNDNSIGWIDWNFALNRDGGPLWVDNPVDASIIVDSEKQEFYKQPQYYSLLHFSKFIPRGSKRIGSKAGSLSDLFLKKVSYAAFLRPDNGVALVILNSGGKRTIKVHDGERGSVMLKLSAHSINTLVYY